MNKNRLRQKGFSMVELLLVVSVIAILASLSITGMKSIIGDRGLTGAGNQMGAILAFARQDAIAKNTYSAVVVLTTTNVGAAQYRALSVWELVLPTNGTAPTSSNWVQASKWQTLPTGIAIDSSPATDPNVGVAASTFLQSATFSPSLPTMSYAGQSVTPSTDCAVQIFLPSGRLLPTSATLDTLTLVEGTSNPTALPTNYVTYIFSTPTGEAKILRP